MGIETLHPDNHPQFKYGDEVEICLYGNLDIIYTGKIVGWSIKDIIDYWIVECEQIYSKEYPYKTFVTGHQFLRLRGDNRPFGCET